MADERDGETVVCQHCGQELDRYAQFCENCGHERTDGQTGPAGDRSGGTGDRTSTADDRSSIAGDPQAAGATQPEHEAATGSSRTDIGAYARGQKLSTVGAGVVAVGAFLPWLSIDILAQTKTGIEGDGVFTLVFALLAVGVIVYAGAGGWSRWTMIGVVVLGVLITMFGIVYINDPLFGVEQADPGDEILVDVEIGLYLTAVGGVLTLAGPLVDTL